MTRRTQTQNTNLLRKNARSHARKHELALQVAETLERTDAVGPYTHAAAQGCMKALPPQDDRKVDEAVLLTCTLERAAEHNLHINQLMTDLVI